MQGSIMQTKIMRLIHALGKRIGTQSVKQAIWDREHAQGQWDWALDTSRTQRQRDIVYEILDQHSEGCDILDLGCANGYTGRMIANHFREYFGVDVSKVAVEAARRALDRDPERGLKTRFATGDILSFVPPKKFSIILLSDCLYYFPFHQIKEILYRYSAFLAANGVFVVRLHDRKKSQIIVEHIEDAYSVLEKATRDDSAAVVLTFVPRR